MRVHYLQTEPLKKPEDARNTVGGSPIVTTGQAWPTCRLCKSSMIFFLQFDLQKSFDLPLKSNSHLLIFMCPIHNDVPTQLLVEGDDQLPENYWEQTFGHYALILNKPSKDGETVLAAEEHLAPCKLNFELAEENIDWDGLIERGSSGFKVGGVPDWGQIAENARCACGAEMIHVLQIPPRHGFAARKGAKPQPDAVAPGMYSLFLGRPTFIFACKQQCTPCSVIGVTQEQTDDLAETA